jgi:hypothetical protein
VREFSKGVTEPSGQIVHCEEELSEKEPGEQGLHASEASEA